jgi:hypothetical protein
MAVIQISKIQQRRGQKLLSGMPQLSSGELAWAVDTQELYIGNGSLAEGAPYVGNTRVLTERDNLLELAEIYRFANDKLSITGSIGRSLQSKIDEIEVSILDFGPPADPSTDQVTKFHLAFAQLFKNTDTTFRKVLKVPNGTYSFKSVLKIPSNVIIRGETRDGVILDINTNGIEFTSASGADQFSFTSTNKPVNISISNLTIHQTTGQTDITGVSGTVFDNVKFTAGYVLGDVVSTPILAAQTYDLSGIQPSSFVTVEGTGVSATRTIIYTSNVVQTIDNLVDTLNNVDGSFNTKFIATRSAESLIITAKSTSGFNAADILAKFTVKYPKSISGDPLTIIPVATQASSGIENTTAAVTWVNTQFGTRTNKVTFSNCLFQSVPLAVKCIQTVAFETVVNFNQCEFFICDTGIYVSGANDQQQTSWNINNCVWEEVAKQAVFNTAGVGMNLHRPRVKNVGNGVNGPTAPLYPMFQFGTKFGNQIVDCFSDRHQASSTVGIGNALLTTTASMPEAINVDIAMANDNYADIYLSDSFTPFAVFSANSRWISIDYIITLANNVRKGILTLSIDDNKGDVAIADNFTYSPSLITDPGGSMMTTFEFNAELISNSTADDSTLGANNETVLLTYKNPLSLGATGTISYTISYGV